MEMEVLILAIILGIITGVIAYKKGYSFFWWFIFGAFIFIIALPWVICLKTKGMKKCTECAESVKEKAIVCKFCGYEFYTKSTDKTTRKEKREILKKKDWGAIDQ